MPSRDDRIQRRRGLVMGLGQSMFEPDTLARFRDRLSETLTRDLQLDSGFSWRMASEVAEILTGGGDDAFEAARARLSEWDIVVQWLNTLEEERSSAIAEWVWPYVRGTVIDLLCGTGRIGERL